MNNIDAIPLQNFEDMSVEALKLELSKSLEITAHHLNYLAAIWRELEARGVDLSDLRHGIMSFLPMIANNRVDAKLVVSYAGQRTLLAALARLPIGKQREVAESGYVTVVKLGEDGKVEVQKPLSQLAAADIYQVFTENDIRSTDEQFRLLSIKSARQVKNDIPRKARRVSFDKEHKVLLVGKEAADMARVVEQVGLYYGVDLARLIEMAYHL